MLSGVQRFVGVSRRPRASRRTRFATDGVPLSASGLLGRVATLTACIPLAERATWAGGGGVVVPRDPRARLVFGYRAPMMRWSLPLTFVVLAIAGVVIALAAIRGDVPWPFAALWVLGLLWNAYWFLVRFGYCIEVDGSDVRWRSVLRQRSVAVTDLTGNGSLWPSFSRVKVRDAASLMMMTGRGWAQFLERLSEVHAGARFQATATDRFVERASTLTMWRTNGFYERDESPPDGPQLPN